MSQLISGETTYDPSKEYYFLDYHDAMEVRHVRAAYMSLEEIQDIIAYHLPFIYYEEQKKCVPMFSNLRITPMKQLEKLYRKWNEDTQQWEDDTITNACVQFNSRYDGYAWLEGPAPSLTKKDAETTEEWKVRVQQRRDELEKQRKEQSSLRRQTRERSREHYPNDRVALLQGWKRRKDELDAFRWRDELNALGNGEQEEETPEISGVGFG